MLKKISEYSKYVIRWLSSLFVETKSHCYLSLSSMYFLFIILINYLHSLKLLLFEWIFLPASR